MIWDLLLGLVVITMAAHAYVLFRDRWPRPIRMPRGWKPPASRDGVQRLREMYDLDSASPGHDVGGAGP